MAGFFVQPAALLSGCDGPRRVAGQELDVCTLRRDRCEHVALTPLDQLRAEVGRDGSRLLEASEHRKRRSPVRAEPVTALIPWILPVLPGHQLGERGGAVEAAMALVAHERSQGLRAGVG